MKRTNLVLNEHILHEAVRALGAKTYSEAVNRSLEETVRLAKLRGLLDFVGSGAWRGDLSVMRKDQPLGRRRKKTV